MTSLLPAVFAESVVPFLRLQDLCHLSETSKTVATFLLEDVPYEAYDSCVMRDVDGITHAVLVKLYWRHVLQQCNHSLYSFAFFDRLFEDGSRITLNFVILRAFILAQPPGHGFDETARDTIKHDHLMVPSNETAALQLDLYELAAKPLVRPALSKWVGGKDGVADSISRWYFEAVAEEHKSFTYPYTFGDTLTMTMWPCPLFDSGCEHYEHMGQGCPCICHTNTRDELARKLTKVLLSINQS